MSKLTCFRCGGVGHTSKICNHVKQEPGNEYRCFSCGQTGHWKNDCPNAGAKMLVLKWFLCLLMIVQIVRL